MADFNIKDDLLGFGRSQLKYMLLHNATLATLSEFSHRKGLFFFDTTNVSVEVLKDNTTGWNTLATIISKNNPNYSEQYDIKDRLVVGASEYGTLQGLNTGSSGFLLVSSSGIPSVLPKILFDNLDSTVYTTVINAPGVNTKLPTEKAVVDYFSTFSPVFSNNILKWSTDTFKAHSSKLLSNPGYAYFFSGTASYPTYNNVVNLDGFLRTANLQVIQGNTQYSITSPTYYSLVNSDFSTKLEIDTVSSQARLYGNITSNLRSLPIRIGSKSVINTENGESILIDDYNRLFNIDMTTVRLNKGTANKYLYLDSNKNITFVDVSAGSSPITVADGLFNLDITSNELTISAFDSPAEGVFYNTNILSITSDPPTFATNVLNYNGAFRTTLLYEGDKRVMTEHGNQISNGDFHALANQFNAGFLPALPSEGGNTKYLRGDGTWQVITESGTANPLTIQDGIFNLDITDDILTVSPFISKTASSFYTGVTSPTETSTYLNFDGIFRATQLYEGTTRVMTTHGNWAANGSLHAVSTVSHAGFCPQLTGSTSNFLRADGTWATMTLTETDTLQTVANRGSVSSIILTYNESKVFTNPYSLVTKEYVDAISAGISPKLPVDAATTANITLSGTQTIDGYSATAGKRILVKNQSSQSTNGIYIVNAGAWTRDTDSDTWAELYRGYYVVLNGTINSGTSYICSIGVSGTVGVNPITFTLYSSPAVIGAGDGLSKVGTTLNVNVDTTTIEIASDILKVKDNVFQPYDLDLISIAGLTGTSGILKKTAANTWILDTTTYITGDVVTSFNTRTGDVTLTKADVEAVLTGLITSHTHSYLPLSGGTVTGNLTVNGTTTLNAVTKVGTTMIPNLNADLLDGYHASAFSLYHEHPYLPLIGGTITGNLVVNGTTTLNSITKVGTTLVTNLNADLLDGYHASAFALASHTHPYQPLDQDLTLIAALTGSGRLVRSGDDNTWGLDDSPILTGTKVDSFNGRTGVVTLLKSDVESVLTGLITSHTHTLAALSDTTISFPASGEILKYNGSKWINNTLAEAGISAVGHTHSYDNYQNWLLKVNGTGVRYVTSLSELNFQASTGIGLGFTSGTSTITVTNSLPSRNATNYTNALSSRVTLLNTGTFHNTILSVTLPEAGKYLVLADVALSVPSTQQVGVVICKSDFYSYAASEVRIANTTTYTVGVPVSLHAVVTAPGALPLNLDVCIADYTHGAIYVESHPFAATGVSSTKISYIRLT